MLPSVPAISPAPEKTPATLDQAGNHCFGSGGRASEARSGRVGVSAGTAPRSSEAATQSPAHNFAPLTTPTSLQPIGSFGFAGTGGFVGVGVWASAAVERQARTKPVSSALIVIPLPAFSAQTAFAT